MEPPQLQVTEAYYRTRASAAGEEGGRADIPWAAGTVPTTARGQPAGIAPSGAGWAQCAEMFSQDSAGQKTRAKPGREGRKEGRTHSAEKDLGRSSWEGHWLSSGVSPGSAFTVQQAAHSWNLQEACKGAPWHDQTVDGLVFTDLSAGDKPPGNLWKVPERTLIPVFKKKALGCSSMSRASLRRCVGPGGSVAEPDSWR